MSNQEVLEKARNKAIKNGWSGSPFIDNANEYAKLAQSKMLTDIVYGDNWWELVVLFMPPHDFAKALWGINPMWSNDPMGAYNDSPKEANWQHHLQLMVISENPIKYLEENM